MGRIPGADFPAGESCIFWLPEEKICLSVSQNV